MPGTRRLNTINIRRGELERRRRELEERLIPLRLRITDLTNAVILARNRVNTDWNRSQDARIEAHDREILITRGLKQTNLGIAIREEEYKRRQHYDNNTMASDAFRQATARLAKLNKRRENKRRSQLNALREEIERTEREFIASRDAHALLKSELDSLNYTLSQLETALSAVVDEEARLNRGRGRKRQHRSTQRKRHFKKH
jgi:chromosome segregation ATPase